MSVRKWRLGDDGRIHRERRKQYPNGDVYEGELVEGRRDGKGKLTTTKGKIYSGHFYQGLFHGHGELTWSSSFHEDGKKVNGRKFIGSFCKGRRNGFGEYFDGFGNVWKGTWKDDCFTGQGILVKKNGEEWEGFWLKGRLNCKNGKVVFSNGDKYEGPVRFNQIHGEMGSYQYAGSGGSYIGQYHQNVKHGSGIRRFLDNSVYQGDFVDGKQCGKGMMLYSSGPRKQYQGDWKDGMFEGEGELTYNEESSIKSIKGLFYQGSPCRATIHYKDGGYYDGKLETAQRDNENLKIGNPDCIRCGQGIRQWSSGNKFEGVWEDDKMVEGVYFNKENCSKYIGTFKNDKKNGYGMETWCSPSGDKFRDPCMGWLHKRGGVCKYEGQYKNGFFHGKGKFMAPDGRIYEGEFLHGKQNGHGFAIMLSQYELGDKERMHIGKHGSLYRAIKYIGSWKNGLFHGCGKLIYLDGSEIGGIFSSGHLCKEGNRTYSDRKI